MSGENDFPILVVEDSDDDLFLFRRLLNKGGITNPLSVATNGQVAIDELSRLASAGDKAAIPRLVFLDLKLPLRSGFEVLEWIRAQPTFRGTAVLVLSSSAEARDVKRAYELGAHGYLVKYPPAAIFQEIVRMVAAADPTQGFDGVAFPGVTTPVA